MIRIAYVLAGLLSCVALPASACVTIPAPLSEVVEAAEYIVVAEALSVVDRLALNGGYRVHIRVDAVYKGGYDAAKLKIAKTETQEIRCGACQIKVGQRYLVFMDSDGVARRCHSESEGLDVVVRRIKAI